MVISKENLILLDSEILCLHDLLITSTNVDVRRKLICLNISDYNKDKFIIHFENVLKFIFSTTEMIGEAGNEIFDWEEIPNKYNQDSFIMEEKEFAIKHNISWNENLFAVRLLLTNMSEIKIICERIDISIK